MNRVLPIVALALLVPALSLADDREQQARELEAMLIAPCCFTQQVSVHQSEAAVEVRRDVRRRLAAGETKEQIVDAYVRQYGKRILAEPPAEGFDRLLYFVPPFALVISAGVVVALVRRFARRRSSGVEADVSGPPPPRDEGERSYDRALEEELRDLD